MNEKTLTEIETLTINSVTIKTQQYNDNNGELIPIGKIHACSYMNSINGRLQLQAEVVEPYKTAIMTVWGTTPTVTEIKGINNTI